MRTLIFTALLAAPVALTACKKTPEPAPEVAKKPALEWSFGSASFDGSRSAGNTGTLTVPMAIINNTDAAFTVKAVELNVKDANDQRACFVSKKVGAQAAAGVQTPMQFEVECDYTKLPGSGPLSVDGHIMWKKGDNDRTRQFSGTVQFSR